MNCEEVKLNLHFFLDNELDGKTKREVETHLHECGLCYNEFKRLRKFFEKLKLLPYAIDPPQDIIESLSKELLDRSASEAKKATQEQLSEIKKTKKGKITHEKRFKTERSAVKKSAVRTILSYGVTKPYSASRFEWREIAVIPIVLILTCVFYFYYDFQKYNSPWDIQCLDGYTIINGKISPSGKLEQGETLSADKTSHITLHIPDVGRLEMSPGSSIELEKAKDGDNIVKVNYGTVKVVGTVTMPSFKIKLSSSSIIDKAGTFSVSVDQNQNANITVENGFVEINRKDYDVFVKEGFVCKVNDNYRPGTPIRIDEPDSLKREIERFDYFNGGDASVEKIISEAKDSDMLTLLSMIPFASKQQREILFQAVVNYFPPPLGVTRLGIVSGDKEMLYKWWEDVEWQI